MRLVSEKLWRDLEGAMVLSIKNIDELEHCAKAKDVPRDYCADAVDRIRAVQRAMEGVPTDIYDIRKGIRR
jgi:hypothetical protein